MLTHTNTQYINLNLELLRGCQFKCSGCYVNKKKNQTLTNHEEQCLIDFVNLFESQNNELNILFINPTDFLSAENSQKILSSSFIKQLSKKFKKLALQTTFLEMNYTESIAEILRAQYKDIDLEINIVFDLNKINHPSYLSTIKRNQTILQTMLGGKKINSYAIINIDNFEQYTNANYIQFEKILSGITKPGIDYNFSLLRNNSLHKEKFENFANSILTLHEDVKIDKHLAKEPLNKNKEIMYSYNSGNIYKVPLFYEYIPIFNDHFNLGPISAVTNNLEYYENKYYKKQQRKISSLPECSTCQYTEMCINRSVINLMTHTGSERCYMPKKNIQFFYQMGTLPF